MSLDWQCALITGGGGGLGKAMAKSLIEKGKKVYLLGRTEKNLVESAKEINAAGYYVLDVSHLETIQPTIDKILAEHPEVDCLINNAGVQKPLDFRTTIHLPDVDAEINTNITGLVYLCVALLPHFLKLDKPCSIQNVSSGLAYVPLSSVPVYSATKAFVKSYTASLQYQLQNTKVKVIEIAPPLVATDLHRDHADPDNNKKEKNPHALSIDEFMVGLEAGWADGRNVIGVGMAADRAKDWENTFGKPFAMLNGMLGTK